MRSVLHLGIVFGAALAPCPQATAAPPITVTHAPLVMRMSKDEFRIAFGINAPRCADGCYGQIHYRVNWRADDGTTRAELKRVSFSVDPHTARSIAVDRQFFDTAEAEHTTEILAVHVERIECHPRLPARAL